MMGPFRGGAFRAIGFRRAVLLATPAIAAPSYAGSGGRGPGLPAPGDPIITSRPRLPRARRWGRYLTLAGIMGLLFGVVCLVVELALLSTAARAARAVAAG